MRNSRAPMKSRLYRIGDQVTGIRMDRPDCYSYGVLVETYVTLNKGWRNAAYTILCKEDGRRRSFQCIRPFCPEHIQKREEIKRRWLCKA